jgi:hypothetical protein
VTQLVTLVNAAAQHLAADSSAHVRFVPLGSPRATAKMVVPVFVCLFVCELLITIRKKRLYHAYAFSTDVKKSRR